MSPEATVQAEAIRAFIEAEAGPATATRFAGRLLARCDKIGLLPHGGTPRDDLLAGIRSVPFRKAATIFYAVTDEYVLIVSILYRGRDAAAHFGTSP